MGLKFWLLSSICASFSFNKGLIRPHWSSSTFRIFMLWFTLDHPAGDLAAVVPVAVATLTPFPLLFALIYYNAKRRFFSNEGQEMVEKINEKEKEATVSLVNSEKLNDKPGLENGESLSIEK